MCEGSDIIGLVQGLTACRDCGRDVCMKHRFGADHGCSAPHHVHHNKDRGLRSPMSSKFLEGLSKRMGGECGPAAVAPDPGNRSRGSNTSVEAH